MSDDRLVTPEFSQDDSAAEHALRPKTLDDFIGQHRVRDQIDVLLSAARARGTAADLDHGAGGAQRRFLGDFLHRQDRPAGDVELIEFVHGLELGHREVERGDRAGEIKRRPVAGLNGAFRLNVRPGHFGGEFIERELIN